MIKTLFWATSILVACGSALPEEDRGETEAGASSSAPQQCIMEAGSLRPGGSGVFKIGTPAERILSECPSAIDTVMLDEEGNPERVIVVRDSLGEIRVEIAEGRVWRVRVTTPRATTDEGIGAGGPLASLLELPGLEVLTNAGQIFVTSSAHCGLSFRLNYVAEPAEISRSWTRSDLERLPPSTAIEEVLLSACQQE